MENQIAQRILTFLKEREMSVTTFSKEIGLVQTTVNRQLKGEVQLSADLVYAFLHYFNNVSAEWLLRGESGMIKDQKPNVNQKVKNFVELTLLPITYIFKVNGNLIRSILVIRES